MNYIANSSGSSMDYADNTASYMETNSNSTEVILMKRKLRKKGIVILGNVDDGVVFKRCIKLPGLLIKPMKAIYKLIYGEDRVVDWMGL